MKAEKNNGTTSASAQAEKRPARKRARAGRVTSTTNPLEASEQCVERIDALLTEFRARVEKAAEGQRSRPDRWEYFAALADLEARLRKALP